MVPPPESDDPRACERVLDRFEEAWVCGPPPDIAEYISAFDASAPTGQRRELLFELIMVDLERHWRRISTTSDLVSPSACLTRPLVEDYAARFSELGPVEDWPIELIEHEYRVRHRWGDKPGIEIYADRFPRQCVVLTESLTENIPSFVSSEHVGRIFEALCGCGTERVFHPGDSVMRQGERGDGAFLIHAGHVSVYVQDQHGRSHAIDSSGPGELVGEMSWVTDAPRAATVVAMTPLETTFVSAADLAAAIESQPQVAQLLFDLVASRLGRIETDALAGKTLGDYRILRRLGRGGMAVVYHVADREGQQYALKMLSHRLVYDPGAAHRFEKEYEIIRSFESRHITRTHGRFKEFGTFFIVLEYCGGGSLDEHIKDHGALPTEQVVEMVRAIAAGLVYAHRRGVIHRDIKPGNLVLTAEGQLKITDFGLAKEGGDDGCIAGTPRYMAPEVIRGEAAGPQADMFSLGLSIVEMATGRPAVSGRTQQAVINKLARWTARDADEICRGVPDAMGSWVRRLVDRDPATRSTGFARALEL